MTDNSDLGPHLESTITALVATGRYDSRDEVLREGVRLIEARESRLSTLDKALDRGVADADAGRVRPVSEVADRLRGKYDKLGGAAGA